MIQSGSPLGKKIIAAIRRVLERCDEVGEKVGFPGEGGERRFRKWIASELLEAVLRWPVKNVVVGERFDVLLLSDDDHALATIETKTPYHNASKKERNDFEERLSGFPTLRTAYFTNGPQWDRLDIVVSGAELRVLERSTFDVSKNSPTYAEQFFAPLHYKSGDETAGGQVYQVNRIIRLFLAPYPVWLSIWTRLLKISQNCIGACFMGFVKDERVRVRKRLLPLFIPIGAVSHCA
jgi:hypothetical protein